MKKILLGLLVSLFLITPTSASVIKKGDTLYGLFGKNWTQVAKNNGITDPRKLRIGQTINEGGLLGNTNYVQTQYFTLYGAGASSGATSIVLTKLVNIDQSLLTMGDFGSKGFGTIEPNNGLQEEQISFTGVTQNANGTATLTGVSSVLNKYPYTETSGTVTTHPGGVKFVISNTVGFYNTFANLTNTSTITGLWTFNVYPSVSSSVNLPTLAANFATKAYVDGVGAGGFTAANVSNTQGTFALGTSPETVGIKASSTQGAIIGADGRFYQQVSSTRELVNSPLGTYINTTTLVNEIATSTPTANKIPIADASSTVDAWTTAPANFNFTQNTLITSTYWNYVIPLTTSTQNLTAFPNLLAGAGLSSVTRYSGFLYFNNNAMVAHATQLMGTTTNFLSFTDQKELRLKFRLSVTSTNALPGVFTIGMATGTDAFVAATTTAALSSVRFAVIAAVGTGTVGSVVSNGAANSNDTFANIVPSNMNTYEIVWTATAAKFYINGTLQKTYSSNLPTSGVAMFGFGVDVGGRVQWYLSDIQVSQQL